VRTTLRLIMVALLGIFELVLLVALLHSYDAPIGQYGFTVGSDGTTITTIEPQQSADLAGLKPGDHIIYKTLPLIGRRVLILKDPVPAQAALVLQFTHSGQIKTVTLHAHTIPGQMTQTTTIISGLAGFILGVIGLILVLFRPSRMTWGFALIAPPIILPLNLLFWVQHTESFAATATDITISLFYALQTMGMLVFASRFPNDNPRGLAAFIDKLAIPAGILIAAIYSYGSLTVRFTTNELSNWEMIDNYSLLLPSLAALMALISTFITTQGSTKSRLAPVIASFSLLIAIGILQQIIPELTSNDEMLFATYLAYGIAPALVAVAVAYGVIRHRVMGVDFIIERTLVFTILTVFIVMIFSVIEFFVGKMFETGRVADAVQMVLAVFVGISINYMHGKLEHFLNLLLFRRRYAARRRLNKTALTLPHASKLDFIDQMLVVEPVEALDLSSAAVFRRIGNDYVRVAAHGWDETTITKLDQDDHLVVRLRAELQPIKVGEENWPLSHLPNGRARPIYVVPVLMGHQLEALLIYGAHCNGADLDSDECKSLYSLARSAALAYGHLTQKQLQDNLQILTAENQALHQIEQKIAGYFKSRFDDNN